MEESITKSQLVAAMATLSEADRALVESAMKKCGIKTPKVKSGDQKGHPKAPNEYLLCWHITCKLCNSEEHKWFHMKKYAELGCLIAIPVDNPAEWEFGEWKTEKKSRMTCPQCFKYLQAKPHEQVCEMVIKERNKQVSIPIF